MDNRDLAIHYIKRIHDASFCRPDTSIDATNKGIGLVLMFLSHNKDKEITAGDLAKNLGISTARIAVLLKKMEAKKLIAKKNSLIDGRITIVSLTEEGIEKINDIHEKRISEMQKFIDYMGKEDIEEIIRIMEKTKKYFEGKE